jgi:hypothetical protein
MRPTIKRIHVNQHNIRINAKHESSCELPVFTIKNRGKTHVANHVRIDGPSELVYHKNDPLSCGAKCWIETTSPVVTDPDTIAEVRIV